MTNKAAWLTAAQVKPFKVDDALMLVPKADEVVIRNRAVAINPTDWAIQAMGIIILTYPFIEGCMQRARSLQLDRLFKISRSAIVSLPYSIPTATKIYQMPLSNCSLRQERIASLSFPRTSATRRPVSCHWASQRQPVPSSKLTLWLCRTRR
jgi:hypothetical protein